MVSPKETDPTVRMHSENTKAMIRSNDNSTNFFDIVVGFLQRDTLAYYLLIICLDYVRQTSVDLIQETSFTLKRQEANDVSQKLGQTQTTQII